MDALKAVRLCALLAAPPEAVQPCESVVQISTPALDRWQTLMEAASQRFGIPVEWIRAVMARESAGLTTLDGRPITSRAGAMGLMQLMPNTWSEMRVRYRLGSDPFDVHDNIFGGTAYLREMFDRFGYPNLFAAYHAGPGRLNAVLAGAKPLPTASESYLQNIVPDAEIEPILGGNRPSAISKPVVNLLFFMRTDGDTSSSNQVGPPREAQGLFVPLASQPISPHR